MSTEIRPSGPVKQPKIFDQLGILVIDGSGSMTDFGSGNVTKAMHTKSAVGQLFNRMQGSRVKQNFSFAYIKFDEFPTTIYDPIAFDFNELDSYEDDYDPTIGKGGTTYICRALEEAEKIAVDFLSRAVAGSAPHKVLILLMSDGMCFEPEVSKMVASKMKQNPAIQIACVYFAEVGKPNDLEAQNLLKDIASDPVSYYTTVYDGEALRSFFEKSLCSSSGISRADLR